MNIEDLIRKQKKDLDVETPPPELWSSIKNEWKQEPPSYFIAPKVWKAAAAIFMILSVTLLLYSISLEQKFKKVAALSDVSDDYKQLEIKYKEIIDQLESSISIVQIRDDDNYQWVFEELSALEDVNMIYLADLKESEQERIVRSLIDYYEKKIQLLRRLQREIDRIKTKNHNEKPDHIHS